MSDSIILASGSPRRLTLLSDYGFDVTVIKPDFDESIVTERDPEKLVCLLAKGKNECIDMPHELVLSADTVVVLDGKILGKPKDRDDAFNMLRALSGRTHKVLTGVCISKGGKRALFCECSNVTFYELTDRQINKYIETGSPFDKAGSYGVQDDMGIGFVRSVTGELSNVIGLPMGRVISEINKIQGDCR